MILNHHGHVCGKVMTAIDERKERMDAMLEAEREAQSQDEGGGGEADGDAKDTSKGNSESAKKAGSQFFEGGSVSGGAGEGGGNSCW